MFVFGILFLLWSWLFSGGGIATQNTGQFGTSTEATQNIVGNTGTSNGQTGLGQNTSNGSIPLGQTGPNTSINSNGGSLANANTGNGSTTVFTNVSSSVSGAQWLSGSGGVNSSGAGSNFNGSAINQVADSNPSGTGPTIITADSGGSGLDLQTALIAAGIGTAACTAGLLGGVPGLATLAPANVGLPVAAANKVVSVPVGDAGTQAILTAQLGTNNALKANDTFKADFLDCVTRALARAALQQITSSVVNWIKSGFNGSPSFVTNPTQFFTNIADQTAGAYIQGSALSFLCSPFQLQIKIAIAQSYANKGAQSCSLSGVIKNVNSFMSGNFSQGGWPGLLSVTTVPTNNSYGAFAYAQIGLSNSITNAQGVKQTQLNQGQGFLTFQQPYNCKPAAGPNVDGSAGTQTCQYKDVTPGSVIGSSLNNQLNIPSSQLNFTQSFDQIISAFMSQLLTSTLYSGLANTTSPSSYLTPDQQLAQTQAQTLLTNMQASVQVAQQYGTTLQGSITDLQSAQQTINTVANCWGGYASTTLSSDKQAQAAANATADQAQIAQLQTQVDSYNNLITQANGAISELQQLESAALSVNSTADVANITSQFTAAQSSGTLVSSNDLTNAQQNRSTLQSTLGVTTQGAQTELAQCNAFGH